MNFSELVQNHLNFLFEIGYFVRPHPSGYKYSDYVVDIVSDKLVIKIVYDRGQVLVDIGQKNDDRKDWFELTDVVGAFTSEIETIYNFPKEKMSFEDSVTIQMVRISYLLKTYCMPFLSGNLTYIRKIKSIEEKRVKELIQSLQSLGQKSKEDPSMY